CCSSFCRIWVNKGRKLLRHGLSLALTTVALRTLGLGQNFLKNKRNARRLVYLSCAIPETLTVDLGAGKGIVTDELLKIVDGPILVIEKDPRLVEFLKNKYKHYSHAEIREGDILEVVRPNEPFVIAANIPFNLSTQVVRRWIAWKHFRQGALLIEKEFGQRL